MVKIRKTVKSALIFLILLLSISAFTNFGLCAKENFLTWNEVDDGNYLDVTAYNINWTDIPNQCNSYVYLNYTTPFNFTCYFDFKVTFVQSGLGTEFFICLWTVRTTYGRMGTGDYGIALYVDDEGAGDWRIYMTNLKDSPWNYDYSVDLVTNTTYYPKIVRNVNVFTVYIYDNSERTSLVDTISIDVTGSPEQNCNFTYVQVTSSYMGAGGTANSSGYLANLDMEIPPPP